MPLGLRLARLIVPVLLPAALVWYGLFAAQAEAPNWGDLAMETLVALAALAGYVFVLRLRITSLTVGWSLITVGLFVDALDELGVESLMDAYVEKPAFGVGYLIAALGLYQSQRALHRQIAGWREAETALREEIAERQRAEASSEAKSEFLANMSHEIRTPMNGVIGMAELLRRSKLTSKQQAFADKITRSAESLLAVLNDILDFSKIEAGELAIEAVDFDLRACAQDVVDLLATTASDKGIALTLGHPEDLHRFVTGDPTRVRQILVNLVGNAVKFTERGWVRLELSSEPSGPGRERFLLSVADTGPGMEPAVLATIFEKFTQADASTTRRHGGTGLGLSITHRLVELMGGSIETQSEVGRGTRFTVQLELPIADAVAESAGFEPPPTPAVNGGSGLRVLIVDDNPLNQEVACEMLGALGYGADTADDGREAIRVFDPDRHHAVLMDCQMPVMDGYEATAELRSRYPDCTVPIVAVTAHAMRRERDRCIEAGMDDYISKPIDLGQLRQTLAALLRGDRAAAPLSG